MNKLAVVLVLLCVLHGARASEAVNFDEGQTAAKQAFLRRGRDLSAVEVDGLGALVAGGGVTNKGTCTMAQRLDIGFARKGEAFRQTTAPSATNCANLCASTVQGCVAINYKEDDGACFFLDEPGYAYVSEGYTTALVKPTVNDVCSSDNMLLNHNRSGRSMPGNPHHVPSATECCLLCLSTPGCIAYAYSTTSTDCWIKNGVPTLTKSTSWSTGLVCLD